MTTVLFRAYGLNSHPVPDEFFEVKRALGALEGEFQWSRITKGGLYILLIPIYYIESFFSQDYSVYLLSGRVIQVLIGTALTSVIFLCLKYLYGSRWALLFILPAVFNVQLIYASHHVNVQNLMFLGVVIHVYLILKYFKEKKVQLLGWSLIPLAVAVASQISTMVVAIPLFFVIIIQYYKCNYVGKKEMLRTVALFGTASLLLYILMTPGIILYFGSTVRNILVYMGLSRDIEKIAGTTSTYATIKNINFWTEYGRYVLNFYGKINLALIILSSLLLVIKRKWLLMYPLGIFLLYYLIFVNASKTTYAGRYIIPGLLMGFIIMPFAIVELYNWLSDHKGMAYRVVAAGIILFISLSFFRNAAFSVEYVKQFYLPDTRDITSRWLAANTLKKEALQDNP